MDRPPDWCRGGPAAQQAGGRRHPELRGAAGPVGGLARLCLRGGQGEAGDLRLRAPRPDVPPAAGAVSRHQPGQVLCAQEHQAGRCPPHRPDDQHH